MAKNIIVLSDGTGNSSGALFKTNVYRIYAALDQRPLTAAQVAAGELRQVAYYDDGVGSSAFRPLAILGGVFGWGLKRNVLDLYAFLCRTYEPGDRIYAFGFSRGAFTIRVLIALVVTQGLLLGVPEQQLRYKSLDAYRAYRRGYSSNRADIDSRAYKNHTIKFLRPLRDGAVALKRRLSRQPSLNDSEKTPVDRVEFIGIWDAVAAYGLPLSEMTRGVDKWVVPLSMPNYRLDAKVARAAHALALDDERDTFHPLLWDEVAEGRMVAAGEVPQGRLQQVWFTGMHSDVGGGYPDDSLAYVSLRWMMGEAADAGLRFDSLAVDLVERTSNGFGTMHNSRQGVAAYYRYQPRKIGARTDPPDETTLLMQDPLREGKGFLTSVKVHQSVLNRIGAGIDRYAPIVLPAGYHVIGDLPLPHGAAAPPPPAVPPPWQEPPGHDGWRALAQERVWDTVWLRRWVYFITVIVTVLLVAIPVFQWLRPPSACAGFLCLLSPAISSLKALLPGFLEYWPDSFARAPLPFLVAVVAILVLRARGSSLSQRIQDGMRALWSQPAPNPVGNPMKGSRVYKIRSSPAYQGFFQFLKWKLAPNVFGFLLFLVLVTLALGLPILVVTSAVNRIQYAMAEDANAFCRSVDAEPVAGRAAAREPFPTNSVCWPTGFILEKGELYEISLTVTEDWVDRSIGTDPRGFTADRMEWHSRRLAILGRRILGAAWFKPVLKIVEPKSDDRHLHVLDLERIDGSTYSSTFTAPATGEAFLFVNDAMVLPFGRPDRYYANNRGAALVEMRRLDEPGAANSAE